MSKDKFSDYDSTAANNTDVGNVGIQGTNRVSNFDDALREVMSHIADNFASDTIASATTTDLGSKAAHYLTISGTTTITGLGTVKAGTLKFVRFSGALTLTHNGTSLILPGAANITTVAGDTAVFVSEGSGNWRCLDYRFNTPSPTVGWERIALRQSVSGSSSDFTSLSAFVMLRLTGFIRPATDGTTILLRTTTDGSNYDSGASDYTYQIDRAQGTTPSATAANAANIIISPASVGNGTSEGCAFELTMRRFNKSAFMWLNGNSSCIDASAAYHAGDIFGTRNQATARVGFRVLCASGDITDGELLLEGVRG